MLSTFSHACWPFVQLPWRNVCSDSFAHLNIRLFAFLLLSCMGSLYVLDINSLSERWLANIFSHSLGCLVILLMVLFVVKKWKCSKGTKFQLCKMSKLKVYCGVYS